MLDRAASRAGVGVRVKIMSDHAGLYRVRTLMIFAVFGEGVRPQAGLVERSVVVVSLWKVNSCTFPSVTACSLTDRW